MGRTGALGIPGCPRGGPQAILGALGGFSGNLKGALGVLGAILGCLWDVSGRSLGFPELSGERWGVLWVSLGLCFIATGRFGNRSKTIVFYCISNNFDDL